MKPSKTWIAAGLAGAILLATWGHLSYAAPAVFSGIDPGAGPGDPRPNSAAAAASFNAATGLMGPVSLIDFESLSIGSFSTMTLAPGVKATLSSNDMASGVTDTPNWFGGQIPQSVGYNTTNGGSKFLGFAPLYNNILDNANIALSFNPPIRAIGFYITGLQTGVNGEVHVQFNDGKSRDFKVPESNAGFFGLTDTGASISLVNLREIKVGNTRKLFGVDDLSYVRVPEPSSIVVMLFGAIGLLGHICWHRAR